MIQRYDGYGTPLDAHGRPHLTRAAARAVEQKPPATPQPAKDDPEPNAELRKTLVKALSSTDPRQRRKALAALVALDGTDEPAASRATAPAPRAGIDCNGRDLDKLMGLAEPATTRVVGDTLILGGF